MFDKLSSRERLLLLFAGILLALLATGLLGHLILEKRSTLKKQLAQARRDVKTLVKLRDEIQSMANMANPPDENQLLATVTQSLQNHNLTASSIRPDDQPAGRNEKKIQVKVTFSGVQLQPLMQFLYDMEYRQTNGITVGDLYIVRALSRDSYDASITVYVVQPAKQGR
jgi:type II secretory pathway component PulM